jgi:PKHD-type hydroxylase
MYYPHVITYPLTNFFTPEECESMLEIDESRYEHKIYTALPETEPTPDLNDSRVRYDFHCADISLDESGWDDYIQRILTSLYDINNQTWQMEVTNIEENKLYLMRFNEGQHYMQWHMNCGGWSSYDYSRRKITFAVNLTPVSTYTGGELQFVPTCRPCTEVAKDIGSGLVYPSYRAHRITPVESGTKYLLMGFVSGPTLK